MDGGEERFAVFGVSCSNTAPALEMQEGIFDPMAEFVEILIVSSLNDTVFLRRDHGGHALGRGLGQNRVGVIPPVRQQIRRTQPFDQAASLRAIRSGTFCNKDSDRQTQRIHGQMDLCVEPPFVRLMS